MNKVASKVMLSFDLASSQCFSETEKLRLIKNLGNRLTKEGMLILTSSKSRSQHTNKEMAVKRFFELIAKALEPTKKRKATVVNRSQKRKRLESKGKQALKKQLRKKPKLDD